MLQTTYRQGENAMGYLLSSKLAQMGKEISYQALKLKAIKLSVTAPFEWASGYRMPIYNDNRRLLADARTRSLIGDGFVALVEELGLKPENIAGTATAGIPHATTMADKMGLPLSYVRSSNKDHGLERRIEGLPDCGSYEGKEVVLIEDLISTGSSSIAALRTIREADGICRNCLAIFSYGFEAAIKSFSAESCLLSSLFDFNVLISTALDTSYVSDEESRILLSWVQDPFGWGAAHGFPRIEKK